MKSVAIIGAGLSGLVCGSLLAKKGHRVTIFESHTTPGGYTAGFRRHGFYFESGTLSLEDSPTVNKAMDDLGLGGKIEFVRQRMRIVAPEFDFIPEKYEHVKQMYLAAFPADRPGLERYFTAIDEMAEAMPSTGKPMPFVYEGEEYTTAMAAMMASGPRFMEMLAKYGDLTMSEFVEKYFEKGSRLFSLLSTGGYPDMAAWMAGMGYRSFIEDYWTVKKGMQSWADALAGRFRELGGDLRLASPVERIITRAGEAGGVVAGREEFLADCVVSCGDYKKTMLQLLGDESLLPADFRERVRNAEVSEGIFVVYLGLDMTNDELRTYLKVPLVSYHPATPADLDFYNANDERFFGKAGCAIYSPSLTDAGHSPEGKSCLMIETFSPLRWMGNWGIGNKEEYKRLKGVAAAGLIGTASKLIPGLKERILFQDAATPLTFERYTHNTAGATSSWSWNPHKKFYTDMLSGGTLTPVRNLFIGSCWSSQMGGIPGAIVGAYEAMKQVGP